MFENETLPRYHYQEITVTKPQQLQEQPFLGVEYGCHLFISLSQSRKWVLPPENFWNSVCDLVHFDAIWWQLFVSRQTQYIYNFAISK